MKNRAKCKLCQTVIESFHDTDYVLCKCDEISVSGGLKMECSAIDWSNFLRVDDQGNEIVVSVKDKSSKNYEQVECGGINTCNDVKPLYNENPTREDKIKMLDDMLATYQNLSPKALEAPITGYDLTSALLIVSSILKS